MPEDKKDEIEEITEDTKNDIIDVNVALVMAENKMYVKLLAERDALIVELTKKLGQATDLIEKDSIAALVAEISPKTDVPVSVLALMSVEDLGTMKKVLDNAKIPAFRAGTPIMSTNKSPEMKLATMFDDFMEKHRK